MASSSIKNVEKQVQDIICNAIEQRKLLWFYYESDSGTKKWRKVEPYIVGIKEKGKGKLYLSGFPDTEISKTSGNPNQRHYFLRKIDLKKLEVLNETYDEPKVPREQITNTPNIKVICRYHYPDEVIPST